MKQEDLFKKLGLILEDLNEQYQFLAQNPQKLNELELELFHANANFLADHVQIVKKIAISQAAPLVLPPVVSEAEQQEVVNYVSEDIQEAQQIETIAFAGEEEHEQELIEEKIITAHQPTPVLDEIEEDVFKLDNSPSTFEFILNNNTERQDFEGNDVFARGNFHTNENKLTADEKFDFEEKSVDEIFNRPLSDEEERIIAEKKKLSTGPLEEISEVDEDEIGPEPFLVLKEADVFPIDAEELDLELAPVPDVIVKSEELVEDPNFKPSLNDLLAGKTNANNLNTSQPSISDLKQGINLNDKLLYIKDLFNGYNLAYAEAIDLANKLPNFEAADNFFQKNYANKNNWAEKQSTVDQFYKLLNQRFK